MSRTYELNPQAAKEANSGGKRITEPGAYTGTFRAAWWDQNERGTEMIGLQFEADNGQEAQLMLYTHNGKGEPLPSFKTLNALMACLKLRKLEAKPGKVVLYDFDAGQDREQSKQVFPAMAGPRIGLVLQGEEYENSQGESRTRMLLAAPFEASTRLMAGEVLDKCDPSKAEQLDRYLKWFEQNKVKRANGRRPAPAGAGTSGSQAAGRPSSEFDDDIPF
jgi:hypothetical protein